MTTQTIELSIEDDVCIVRRMPAEMTIPPEGGSVLEALTRMSPEELEATKMRLPALENMVNGIANTKRIFNAFPGAQKVAHCACERGIPFGVCQHPRLHNLSGHVRQKFVMFDDDNLGACNTCKKSVRMAWPSIGEDARRVRRGSLHLHANIQGENGTVPDAILYLYHAGQYIAAKQGSVPSEVLRVLKTSPATLHRVASPEVIDTKVDNPQRIRDPLLLAGWDDKTPDWYIIHQWE